MPSVAMFRFKMVFNRHTGVLLINRRDLDLRELLIHPLFEYLE